MSTNATTLACSVLAMRPMVPAKDFETSKRFYIELGFEPKMLTDGLCRDATWRILLYSTGLLCRAVGR